MTPTMAPCVLPVVQRATAAQLTLGASLVVVEVATVVMAVIVMFFSAGTEAGVTAALLGMPLLVADLTWHLQSGQGVAWRLTGLRQLATVDDSPLGINRVVPPTPTWTATVRGRSNPIDIRAARPEVSTRNSYLAPSALGNPSDLAAPMDSATQLGNPATSALASAPGLAPLPPGIQFELHEAGRSQAREPQGMGHYEISRPHGGSARVTVDGQSRYQFARLAVVGRRPSAGASGATEITVNDLERTLSKNHLQLTLDDDGIITVMDLGSTNGTEIVDASGLATSLAAHEPIALERGAVVVLGGHRLTFGDDSPAGGSS